MFISFLLKTRPTEIKSVKTTPEEFEVVPENSESRKATHAKL
jgi:hypothetical protein